MTFSIDLDLSSVRPIIAKMVEFVYLLPRQGTKIHDVFVSLGIRDWDVPLVLVPVLKIHAENHPTPTFRNFSARTTHLEVLATHVTVKRKLLAIVEDIAKKRYLLNHSLSLISFGLIASLISHISNMLALTSNIEVKV